MSFEIVTILNINILPIGALFEVLRGHFRGKRDLPPHYVKFLGAVLVAKGSFT